MKILADASLPQLSDWFLNPFSITYYQNQNELIANLAQHTILVCRSTLSVTPGLLKDSSIECVATASSGTEHIAVDWLQKQGIVLFDAKGANAASVADYVTACLAVVYPSDVIIKQRAGIVGFGEVGQRVAKRLLALGFEVIYYDPFKVEPAQLIESVDLNELLTCDVICIHANWHDSEPYPSHNMFNFAWMSQLKAGVVIINAARGGIVNERDLLLLSKPLHYCTDVYSSEPAINQAIIDYSLLCTPHIAGHSLEAKASSVSYLSQKIHAHYHLTPPQSYSLFADMSCDLTLSEGWQNAILSIYDPRVETNYLKSANNTQQAFLQARKAHNYRHDFSCYDSLKLSRQLRSLLGVV